MRRPKLLLLVALSGVLAFATLVVLTRLPTLEGRSETHAFINTQGTPLGRALSPLAAKHPGQSAIRILPDAHEALAARTALVRAATRSIDAQYYIWHRDLTGSYLFNELGKAADRGVRVRLLLDDNNTGALDEIIATLDAHPNIEIRLFNPFVLRKPRVLGFLTDFSRLNRRMHNKSFTADNQATIVGGRNIGDEYFGAGGAALFVDLDVLAAGPVVADVSQDFDRYWASPSAYPADRIVPALSAGHIRSIRRLLSNTGNGSEFAQTSVPLIQMLLAGGVSFEWTKVRMISDHPAKGLGLGGRDDLLFSKLTASMGEPTRSLDLVSGYFVPGNPGTTALAAMAQRNTKVTILTNALEATDVPIVHAGYAKRREPLLRAGVRIFELRGADAARRPERDVPRVGSSGSRLSDAGSALHAKTFVVDGTRLFVGSFNFDPRSANLNTELGFVIESPLLARGLHEALTRHAPLRAYEVRLSRNGSLYWLERNGMTTVRHDVEPGTTVRQRGMVQLLSLLPIDWLL